VTAIVTMRVGGGGAMGFATNTIQDLIQPPEFGEHGVTLTDGNHVNFFPYANLMHIGWTRE
jgi:hypothetical protein